MRYWISGLPRTIANELIDSFAYADSVRFWSEPAAGIDITYGEVIDKLVRPLAEFGLDLSFSQTLELERCESFESVLTNISLAAINHYLAAAGLPMYRVHRLDTSNLPLRKFYSPDRLTDETTADIERRIRRKTNAHNEILKRAKGFRSFPDDETLSKIAAQISTDPRRSCSLIDIIPSEVRATAEGAPVTIDSTDMLDACISSQNKVISPHGAVPYIDGATMIDICFAAADEFKVPIALQRFIRDKGYAAYRASMREHPRTVAVMSSCCTWNLAEFPEFDKNLIFGVAYANKGFKYDAS